MAEVKAEQKRCAQEYRELSPADQAVFKAILELAVILLKSPYLTTEPKKGETKHE